MQPYNKYLPSVHWFIMFLWYILRRVSPWGWLQVWPKHTCTCWFYRRKLYLHDIVPLVGFYKWLRLLHIRAIVLFYAVLKSERVLFAVNAQHSRENLKESLLLKQDVTSDVQITKPTRPRGTQLVRISTEIKKIYICQRWVSPTI